jgi:hypothetical protein
VNFIPDDGRFSNTVKLKRPGACFVQNGISYRIEMFPSLFFILHILHHTHTRIGTRVVVVAHRFSGVYNNSGHLDYRLMGYFPNGGG